MTLLEFEEVSPGLAFLISTYASKTEILVDSPFVTLAVTIKKTLDTVQLSLESNQSSKKGRGV